MVGKITQQKRWDKIDEKDLEKMWSGIRAGRKDSLSRLFCFTHSWLFSYGYKIVPREAFVKDTIQELFLNLWERKNGIRDAISVRSYLLSSFRRLIFRRLRKQKNRMKRNRDYQKEFNGDTQNTEELIIKVETNRERKRKISLAMESLSNRQKEAVCLKFSSGLSSKEIADIMQINKQSVYNHVSKAITKMQGMMQV